MATTSSEILAQLAAGQTDLQAGQTEIIETLNTQAQVLRLIAERLGVIIEKLTPAVSEGPTMQELLAELVTRVGDNAALLRRIDRRTESMAMSLPDDVVRAMKEAPGANGNGSNGHTPGGRTAS
ncbi:hypothetical protein HN018_23435 (plasmid) [Lichenicola cladoniae]|uniref:Uncharacterized protein n=1 Tax=Lichenicola cladoniae TaxID=1484109 RepID=A0A6M8HX59_9PROT|nr:hypothetical protein [Lichenicola cladoniae]NPD66327.1 hypothetical protein [Acetobacteraceae bacterium]QKE93139.1 hypothetical protein HN018_23435 [Lichenicola cladoniae]